MARESYDASKAGKKFFKPAENKDAVALHVVYKGFQAQRPGYQGKLQDMVNVDITVFRTVEDIDNDNGEEFVDQWLHQGALVGFLKNKSVGDEFIRKLGQLPPQNGNQPAWVLNAVDSEEIYQKVDAWCEAKEQAVAEAMKGDDVPPWLK